MVSFLHETNSTSNTEVQGIYIGNIQTVQNVIEYKMLYHQDEKISRETSVNIIMKTTERIPESADEPTLKQVLNNIQIKDANCVLQTCSTETLVSII